MDKFRVNVYQNWGSYMLRDRVYRVSPSYFDNFWSHCQKIAEENNWLPVTVANYQLKPLGGKLIQTRTQGWYLRWDTEAAYTAFVLRWS